MLWLMNPWRRMFDFRGRATRSEYWLFLIQFMVIWMVWVVLMGLAVDAYNSPVVAVPMSLILMAFWAIGFIAYLSASVRRLHDHDKTGWLFLLVAVPLVGWIFFLIMMLTPGTPGENSYGLDPRDPNALADDVAGVFY